MARLAAVNLALAAAVATAATENAAVPTASALASFQRVTSVCSTCDIGPQQFKPSPGATERLQEPDFAHGGEYWSCYTDGCDTCSHHVQGATTAKGYTITFKDMEQALP